MRGCVLLIGEKQPRTILRSQTGTRRHHFTGQNVLGARVKLGRVGSNFLHIGHSATSVGTPLVVFSIPLNYPVTFLTYVDVIHEKVIHSASVSIKLLVEERYSHSRLDADSSCCDARCCHDLPPLPERLVFRKP
jgi:hypothetical protein